MKRSKENNIRGILYTLLVLFCICNASIASEVILQPDTLRVRIETTGNEKEIINRDAQSNVAIERKTEVQNKPSGDVKEVKGGRPDMTKSKGARPPSIGRPAGLDVPQGAGKPAGAGRPAGAGKPSGIGKPGGPGKR